MQRNLFFLLLLPALGVAACEEEPERPQKK